MKKPNITKGEWCFDGEDEVFTLDNDDSICTMEPYVIKHREEQQANAKAISSVPNLIDALIEDIVLMENIKKYFERRNDSQYTVDAIQRQIDRKNKVLIKAGCTE